MIRPLTPPHKSLASIAELLETETLHGELEITGLTHDSANVQPGDIFLAFPGQRVHGAKFAAAAKDSGAVAVLTDSEGAEMIENIPVIVVKNPRRTAGTLSAWFYGEPMRDIFSVGITGTNGKTTTTTLLHQIWTFVGHEAGLVGTVEMRIGREVLASKRTTPESSELQALVAAMRERHVRDFAMEVSSHALVLERMKGSHFAAVGFTNLSQDHLDFHSNMEEYFQAKAALFTFEYSDLAIINIDDLYGQRLVVDCQIPYRTLSRTNSKADWSYVSSHKLPSGNEVVVRGPGGILLQGQIPLHGEFNLDNALMAIAMAFESGVDPLDIQRSFTAMQGAAGRLEAINVGQDFLAFVDYAHSPDAVATVLHTCSTMTSGRLIAVLGCGGDRDTTKRILMGDALRKGADIAVFTSDNPRSENPDEILKQMLGSHVVQSPSAVITDRAQAIAYAASLVQSDDVLIVLGKGHETGQEIAGVVHPFDDRLVLAQAIGVKK